MQHLLTSLDTAASAALPAMAHIASMLVIVLAAIHPAFAVTAVCWYSFMWGFHKMSPFKPAAKND